jgi:hypothetical protein
VATRAFAIDSLFDLRRTVRALGVGVFDDRGVWWWATDPGAGPTTVAIEQTSGGVNATTWGPGSDTVMERIPTYLGTEDDWDHRSCVGPAAPFMEGASGFRLGAPLVVHAARV